MRSLSPIRPPENNEDVQLNSGSKEPHVKITSDSTDIKQRKKDTVNNLSTLTPFYLAKIKANANIRIPAATAANYLSGRNSVSKHYQTVNVGTRAQCQTSTKNKDLNHPQGGKTVGGQTEGDSVGYRTRNKRNVVS